MANNMAVQVDVQLDTSMAKEGLTEIAGHIRPPVQNGCYQYFHLCPEDTL